MGASLFPKMKNLQLPGLVLTSIFLKLPRQVMTKYTSASNCLLNYCRVSFVGVGWFIFFK